MLKLEPQNFGASRSCVQRRKNIHGVLKRGKVRQKMIVIGKGGGVAQLR